MKNIERYNHTICSIFTFIYTLSYTLAYLELYSFKFEKMWYHFSLPDLFSKVMKCGGPQYTIVSRSSIWKHYAYFSQFFNPDILHPDGRVHYM